MKTLVVFFTALAVASWTMYAATRFSAQYATQMEVAKLRVQYTDLDKRTAVLEHGLLSVRPPTVQVTTPTRIIEPTWYRNREATIDLEITALTKRIAELEKQKKEQE